MHWIYARSHSAARLPPTPRCSQFWYSPSVRSALLSILVLSGVALASLGTSAQSNQPTPPNTALQQRPTTNTPSGSSPAAGITTVVLDPAHGGSDSGARGPSGATESDIVLDFARAIRVALESQGLRVLFTREGNQDPSFDDRAALINSLNGAVFISLHVSSSGPIGTVRAYTYAFPAGGPAAGVLSGVSRDAATTQPAAPAHPGLVEWDQAQRPHLKSSEQLAALLQVQLAQKFNGSPETPLSAPVRQLRSVAAPAIAIEASSVAVTDPQQLARMAQPLAEAISRAVVDFRAAGNAAPSPGGVR